METSNSKSNPNCKAITAYKELIRIAKSNIEDIKNKLQLLDRLPRKYVVVVNDVYCVGKDENQMTKLSRYIDAHLFDSRTQAEDIREKVNFLSSDGKTKFKARSIESAKHFYRTQLTEQENLLNTNQEILNRLENN